MKTGAEVLISRMRIATAFVDGLKSICAPMRIFCCATRQYIEVVKGGEMGCFLGWLGVGGYGKC
jgi:hypothetical protein